MATPQQHERFRLLPQLDTPRSLMAIAAGMTAGAAGFLLMVSLHQPGLGLTIGSLGATNIIWGASSLATRYRHHDWKLNPY